MAHQPSKLAHYRRVKPAVEAIGTPNAYAAAAIANAWRKRQIIRDFKAKSYATYHSPVVEFNLVPPPDDYLLRLSGRHGRKFKNVPQIAGYGLNEFARRTSP